MSDDLKKGISGFFSKRKIRKKGPAISQAGADMIRETFGNRSKAETLRELGKKNLPEHAKNKRKRGR